MANLEGQVAVVTGAAGGIGQAIVRALQAAGARVVGVDLLESAADHMLVGDLSDPLFCDDLPRQAAARRPCIPRSGSCS